MFISSSTKSPGFKLFTDSSFCLFLKIILGEKVDSELLYPLNLIDCPNRDCKIESPSYNFNLLTWCGSKYLPSLVLLSLELLELEVPVCDIVEYDFLDFEESVLSNIISFLLAAEFPAFISN